MADNTTRLAYDGLKDGGTFYLDGATVTKIKADPDSIVGKLVTFVDGAGEPMVGFGTSGGSPIAGQVIDCKPTNEYSAKTAAKDFVVTIWWNRTFVDVPTTPSVKTAVAGKWIAVNENGEAITAESTVATNAFCLSVAGSSTKTAVIRVL